jgi:hypothetical protein
VIVRLMKRADILTPAAIRRGISVAVLVMCTVLGWQTPELQNKFSGMGMEIVIGGIFFLLFLILSFKYIEFGVLTLVLTAFFIRFTLPTGTYARLPASMVLAGLMVAVWIVLMFLRHRVQLGHSKVTLPAIGFILISLISLPWSWLSWRPELWTGGDAQTLRFQVTQLASLAVMILLPAVFLMTMNVVHDAKWIKWLVISVVVIALPELVQRLLGKYLSFGGIGISGPGLYHLWLIALLYAQLLFNQQLSSWIRLFFVLLIAGWLFYVAILKIEWISGWLPPLVAILLLTFLKSKKGFAVLLLFLALMALLASGFVYEKIIMQSVTEDSNRLWLWQTIIFDLTFSKAGIVFGAGPAGYAPYFMAYYPGQAMSAHSNYVDIIAETGIMGTIFFLWFLFAVLRIGWSLNTKIKDDFLLAFNNGVLAGFIGMLVAMALDDWFIPFAYNNGLPGFDMTVYAWILLGAMVSLEQWAIPGATQMPSTT